MATPTQLPLFSPGPTCTEPGCTGKFFAKGRCQYHYLKLDYNQRPNARARRQQYYQTYKAKFAERQRAQFKKSKRHMYFQRSPGIKRWLAKVKQEVMAHYSHGTMACVRCGFNDIRALQLDHVNNDGGKHRRALANGRTSRRGSQQTYQALKRRGFPSGFQVLCANCNTIKHVEYRESLRHAYAPNSVRHDGRRIIPETGGAR